MRQPHDNLFTYHAGPNAHNSHDDSPNADPSYGESGGNDTRNTGDRRDLYQRTREPVYLWSWSPRITDHRIESGRPLQKG